MKRDVPTPCPLPIISPFLHQQFSKWQTHVPSLPFIFLPSCTSPCPLAHLPALMLMWQERLPALMLMWQAHFPALMLMWQERLPALMLMW